MTKREAIETILSGHIIDGVKFDCDLDEEADEILIKGLEKIRDWLDAIDEEKQNETTACA